MVHSPREKQKIAKETIERARKDGHKLERVGDIKEILQARIEEFELRQDYFACLPDKYLHKLLKPMKWPYPDTKKNITEPLHSCSPARPGPTLPPTPDQSEHDEQSQPGSDDGTQRPSSPIGQSGSAKIGEENVRDDVRENKLSKHVEKSRTTREQTIRLTWREQATQRDPKKKSTRFRIMADDEIWHDLVIGTSCDDSDSEEPNDDDDNDDDENDDGDDSEDGEYDQFRIEEEDKIQEEEEEDDDDEDEEDDEDEDDDDDDDETTNNSCGGGYKERRARDSVVDESDEFDSEDQAIDIISVRRRTKPAPRSSKSLMPSNQEVPLERASNQDFRFSPPVAALLTDMAFEVDERIKGKRLESDEACDLPRQNQVSPSSNIKQKARAGLKNASREKAPTKKASTPKILDPGRKVPFKQKKTSTQRLETKAELQQQRSSNRHTKRTSILESAEGSVPLDKETSGKRDLTVRRASKHSDPSKKKPRSELLKSQSPTRKPTGRNPKVKPSA
ncbi:MAG: hypothetical protein Q9165_008778 [Trypethelium subeluteriae]